MASQSQETVLNYSDYYLSVDFHWATAALLVYEYVLTLDDEIEYIWRSRWSIIKFLYLVSRYTPFLDSALLLSAQIFTLHSPMVCAALYHGDGWIFFFGTALTEILLSVRTWAVWGRDKRVTIGLPIFFVLVWTPMLYLMYLFQKAFDNFIILNACFVSYNPGAPPILWTVFVLLMVYDTGLAILMCIKAYSFCQCFSVFIIHAIGIKKLKLPLLDFQINQDKTQRTIDTANRRRWSSMTIRSSRERSKRVSEVVFQDGLLYYLFLFAFSAIQVGISRTSRSIVMSLLPGMHRVLHAALACRIVINIRKHNDSTRTRGLMLTDDSYLLEALPGPQSPTRAALIGSFSSTSSTPLTTPMSAAFCLDGPSASYPANTARVNADTRRIGY